MSWTPTSQQQQDWEERGFFLLRGVVPPDQAYDMRGVVKNVLMTPEPDANTDADPMDPMGDTPEARTFRFRKLNRFCHTSPLIWHTVHAGAMAPMGQHYLGDDVLLKFSSVFVKSAWTGAATPWHQDNGLWRDGETEPFNFWMALDPATVNNACLQFIPGSHKTEIVSHVLYEDSIHGELPRPRVEELKASNGVEHIELHPGDVVCWHSSLWHYSPVNTSPQGRVGIAGVYTTPELVEASPRSWNPPHWVVGGGELRTAYPPEEYVARNPGQTTFVPFPKAEEVGIV
ncbi:MAG: phytanoyl-CoA dioxygenase family protein [Candidatus Latescibacterota bacterium]|nr:phytanoyl-CoA dioxygenase family protein [Candidatus Latescibacterota bacterium]